MSKALTADKHPLDDIIRSDRMPHIWCPGCGIGISLGCFIQALQEAEIDRQLAVRAVRVPPGDEAGAKAAFVRKLGGERVVAIGNGANDAAMLYEAAIGIAVMSPEGLAAEAVQSADVIAPGILEALGWLERPMRLVASLRR